MPHVLAILGDSSALGPKEGEAHVAHSMAPYCDDIVTGFSCFFRAAMRPKTLKPEGYFLFGDIVLA